MKTKLRIEKIARRQTQNSTPKNKKHRKPETLFLLPSLIGVLVFFLAPFGVIFYYALINNPMQHQFVFFDNFKALLSNSAFRLAAVNTVSFSLAAVPLAVILSLGLPCCPSLIRLKSFVKCIC